MSRSLALGTVHLESAVIF